MASQGVSVWDTEHPEHPQHGCSANEKKILTESLFCIVHCAVLSLALPHPVFARVAKKKQKKMLFLQAFFCKKYVFFWTNEDLGKKSWCISGGRIFQTEIFKKNKPKYFFETEISIKLC